MPKNKKNLGNQQHLSFNSLPFADDLLIDVKRALTRVIKKKCSRPVLASHLTAIMKKNVTVDMLNNWTAESKPAHIPPYFAVIYICDYCHDFAPLNILFKPFGVSVITKAQLDLLEIGKAYLKQQESEYKIRSLVFKRTE